MRTLIDISEHRMRALNALARVQSRAVLMREAVDTFLGRHRRARAQEVFGLWGKAGEGDLAYQDRLRGEF